MTKKVVVAVVVLGFLGLLALPVKELCGGQGKVCATAPDDDGYIHYYYEKQPLLTPLIYAITGRSVPLVYSRGIELHKIR
ncbi:hypothetical protein MSP7336_03088 [Mycobacterium shimoidei]|uniref:Uncharacterized protein n=1 Tax=Mycobacterium shimoidei TaxID=29313 RepID=A0A375Z1G5_MYCSH|nr:hypothetical protein [Mycobacterium shimoidei]SRX94825.1 hypothetical protein MSP7336_03088 [Mycobacterium shimoidei]